MQHSEVAQLTTGIERLRAELARRPNDVDLGLMLGFELVSVGSYISSIVVLKAVIAQQPKQLQALQLLARASASLGNIPEALSILDQVQNIEPNNLQSIQYASVLAIEIRDWYKLVRIATIWTHLNPDCADAWQALSRAHFEQSNFSEAMEAFEKILRIEPNNPSHLISAARISTAAENYRTAFNFLEKARKICGDSGEIFYALSRLYHLTGQLEVAEKYCVLAIKSMPKFAPAYVSLSALREGKLDHDCVNAITALLNDPTIHPEYRVMLGLTLGDSFDSRGEYERAFEAWKDANEINKSISDQEGYSYLPGQVERDQELINTILSKYIEQTDDSRLNFKNVHPLPVFIVGMPRSGTTLVESILSSHSLVFGAGELPTLCDIHENLVSVAREQGVGAACDLLREKKNIWRGNYMDALPPAENAKFIIDKQPLNFRSVGLIRLLFPTSPIIHTHRSPLDVCLSIFRHKFSKHWPCAHQLTDIGHYYVIYTQTLKRWQELYPGTIHTVNHALLVRDTEMEIRRLLSFVDLEIEECCFAPHKKTRPISTFSAVQVQRPVSASYGHRAARYGDALAPLYEVLTKGGVDLQ